MPSPYLPCFLPPSAMNSRLCSSPWLNSHTAFTHLPSPLLYSCFSHSFPSAPSHKPSSNATGLTKLHGLPQANRAPSLYPTRSVFCSFSANHRHRLHAHLLCYVGTSSHLSPYATPHFNIFLIMFGKCLLI